MNPDAVAWHDLECGGYTADLSFWHELARVTSGPILDLGAGTGRVSLSLARVGVPVVAVDFDPDFVEVLTRRAADLPVTAICDDVRTLSLGRTFDLILAPMQTVQLLDGAAGRRSFLESVRRHCGTETLVACALAEDVEPYDAGGPGPEILQRDGRRYSSDPYGISSTETGYLLHRARTLTAGGVTTTTLDDTALDRLDAAQFEAEAEACGFRVLPRGVIAPTDDHVASAVVMLGV